MYNIFHTLRARYIREANQALVPSTIEQTAGRIFESFSDRLKAMLNGRQERALKLALEGHVTHKFARTFNVRSEDNQHSYLVNLEKSFCTCPDSRQGSVCKHRLAAYLVEQSLKASQEIETRLPDEPSSIALQSVSPEPVASNPPPSPQLNQPPMFPAVS